MNTLAAKLMALLFAACGARAVYYGGPPIAQSLNLEATVAQIAGAVFIGMLLSGLLGYVLGPSIWARTWKAISWVEERVSGASLPEIAMGTGGLIIGLIIANLVRPTLVQIPLLGSILPVASMLLLGYLGLMIARTKKDDIFAVTGKSRMAKQSAGLRPKVLDTSVIIDGRIARSEEHTV